MSVQVIFKYHLVLAIILLHSKAPEQTTMDKAVWLLLFSYRLFNRIQQYLSVTTLLKIIIQAKTKNVHGDFEDSTYSVIVCSNVQFYLHYGVKCWNLMGSFKKKKKKNILFLHGPGSLLDSAGLLGRHRSAQHCSEMAGKWSNVSVLSFCWLRVDVYLPEMDVGLF